MEFYLVLEVFWACPWRGSRSFLTYWGACLLVIRITASVMLYVVLLRIFKVGTVKEKESAYGFKEEETTKELEYQLMIVCMEGDNNNEYV